MPDSWVQTTLGSQLHLQRGFDITKDEQRNGPVPVVSSGGIASYHDTAAAKGPGVVLGRKGLVGSVYYIASDFWPHDTTLWVKDFKGNEPRFVFYFFKHMAARLAALDVGSANPTLNRNHVHPTPVSWPPHSEQKAIARILGSLDDKIDLNRRMNCTLEGMAEAIFRSWFVDFDPVRAKSECGTQGDMDAETAALFPSTLEQHDNGRLPSGWSFRPVSDVAGELFDGPHATPPESPDGPVFLGIRNLPGSTMDLTEVRRISERDWPRWTKRVAPRKGDIVFTYEATLGHFALVPPGLRCCLGRRTALIRPNESLPVCHYLLHWFVGPTFQRFLRSRVNPGATVDRILLTDFPSYPVLWPPSELVRRFEDVVSPIWAKLHANEAQSRTLASLRETLTPKLVSGELRVNDAETVVAARA